MTCFSDCTAAVLTSGWEGAEGSGLCWRGRGCCVCAGRGVDVHSSKALHGVRQSWEWKENRAGRPTGWGLGAVLPYVDFKL